MCAMDMTTIHVPENIRNILVFQPHHLKVFQASIMAIWAQMNPISHLGILLAITYKVAKIKIGIGFWADKKKKKQKINKRQLFRNSQ